MISATKRLQIVVPVSLLLIFLLLFATFGTVKDTLLVVSGEDKGTDIFQGAPAPDTAMTRVYVRPQLTYTWSEQLSAQLGVDLPVLLDSSALQTVPDYRIRAAVNCQF